MNKNTTIRHMILIYKKWWLLQQFHSGKSKHTQIRWKDQLLKYGKELDFAQVPLTKFGLLRGTEKYPGIVFKSYIFGWLFKPKFNLDKINLKKWDDLNDIYESCYAEGYLDWEKDLNGKIVIDDDGNPKPIKGKRFGEMQGIAKLLHNEYEGLSGFWKIIGWSVAMFLFLTGLNGKDIINWIKNEYNDINKPRQEQLIPKNETIIQIPQTSR